MTTPTITESKLKNGRLTLGGVEFSCQPTNVTISSDYEEDGDPVEVLCGAGLPAATTVSKTLKITAIQDFTNPTGFMRYLREHELETVAFVWQATPAAETASGTVQCRLGDWGGDVGKRLTTAPELPITPGSLVWTPPTPATGATAGTPGTWTPDGSAPPANEAACTGLTADPATAWTAGQYVVCADNAQVHWDGAAWDSGPA